MRTLLLFSAALSFVVLDSEIIGAAVMPHQPGNFQMISQFINLLLIISTSCFLVRTSLPAAGVSIIWFVIWIIWFIWALSGLGGLSGHYLVWSRKVDSLKQTFLRVHIHRNV